MHVLHIVLGLQTGGLEKLVLSLIDQHSQSLRCTILCLDDPTPNDSLDSRYSIVRWQKKQGVDLSLIWRIRSLIKAQDVDVVHTHNPAPHFYGAIATRLSGKALIHTKHGRNYPDSKKRVLLNRFSASLSDRVVAVSSDARKVCTEIEGIPPAKVITILNGVNLNTYSPKKENLLRPWLGAQCDDPIIGIVARLSPEKNHSLLLDACAHLRSQRVLFNAVIIGDGPCRKALEERSRELNLSENVHFLGNRNDVEQLLSGMTVFTLCSLSEGVSLTLLEAMGAELPVVATDVGGNKEVVADGVTGFLVPLDPLALASSLTKLIQPGPEAATLRREFGKAGRKRALQKFSIDASAQRYLDLYKTVI